MNVECVDFPCLLDILRIILLDSSPPLEFSQLVLLLKNQAKDLHEVLEQVVSGHPLYNQPCCATIYH